MTGVGKHGRRALIAAVVLALPACATASGDSTTTTETPPTTSTSTTTTTWPPRGDTPIGRIAFVSDREGNDDIYVMNADGSEVERLTDDPANDWAPTWLPGSERLLFLSERTEPTDLPHAVPGGWVYSMAGDGSDQRRMTTEVTHGLDIEISPDGRWLSIPTEFLGLHILEADTFDLEMRFSMPGWSWAPDGTRLAGIDRSGLWGNLTIMEFPSLEKTRLSDYDAFDYRPAWSPDGTTIAFESDYRDDGGVYLVTPQGTARRPLPTDLPEDASLRFPTWSPDGSQLLVHRSDAASRLYVIDPQTGESVELAAELESVCCGAWSPDGHWIAVLADGDIYVSSSDGEILLQLTDDQGSNHSPTWDPGP